MRCSSALVRRVAGWAVATAAAAAAALAFSFYVIVLITGSKAVLFFFFFFSFSFNPFNAAIIEAYRDKSLIAMLSFSFSPHPLYIRFSSILFRDNR